MSPLRPSPFAACLALAALAVAARAQDLGVKAPPQSRPVVLRNATLHTIGKGTIVGGTLWFHEGVIRGVLPAGEAPLLPEGSDPLVVDLANAQVYPGLIAAHSQLGLLEIGMVKQTVDVDEVGELTPEALAAVAVNPDSAALPVARSNGVLAAAVFPSGGLLPGRASVVQLDGWTNADLAVRGDAGVVVAWPAEPGDGPGRRGRRRAAALPGAGAPADPMEAVRKARARIDEQFARAQAWLDARRADPAVGADLRAQSLVPALRGEVPVFLLADETEQIESAVAWAVGRGLRPVVVGGRDAAACGALLRERDVPVILGGTFRLPHRDDAGYDEPFALPALLAERGIRFCIATGDEFSNERNLAYHAAQAVAFGLDPQRALAAITRDAAEILGVGDRLGSLEAGKDATLFVADGSPLELTTKVTRAFVRGREVDLRNKQTELARKYREKYRQLQGK